MLKYILNLIRNYAIVKMDWKQLGLSESLCRILKDDFGFAKPTPVQRAGIPHFLGNKDICVESCTGSGKTLTFLLPILHKLEKAEFPKSIFALIISPSRELASQTYEIAEKFSSLSEGLGIQCLIGGHSRAEDITKLETEAKNIIIGTPGRIYDLIQDDKINMKNLEVLILDEADRLLDMGFKDTIQALIKSLPKQRRTGLFSATMTTDVESLVKAGLRNPVYINIKIIKSNTQQLPKGLTNYCTMFPTYYEKLPALANFLLENQEKKIIVFFGTCASTNFYLYILTRIQRLNGLKFYRLHGKMKQGQRERVYKEYAGQPNAILLTTDLIARGIDFPDINWIIQYDPPQNPDFFVHRIGRTARMNKVGESILFLQESESTYINYLSIKGIEFTNMALSAMENIYDEAQQIIIQDREGYERAQSAFVSYVRYYKEHHLNFIFEFKKLDLGYLAQGFSMLRIPRITEILGKKIENFVQSDLNPDDIPYLDSKKENQRLNSLEEKAQMIIEQKLAHKKKKNKEKNCRKRSRSEKREAKRVSMVEDFDELGKEERIIKKVRKGHFKDPEVIEYINENPHIKTFFRKKKH